MFKDFLISPFLLGLSVGVYCFATCIPFIAPLMVLQKRSNKENLFLVGKFILGRFVGYVSFGAFVGYLGEKIQSTTVNSILTVSLMVLALILIIHSLGYVRTKKFSFCSKSFYKKVSQKSPLLMGFLMGVNICPPFLMSLFYVFSLGSILKGIIYFIFFFLGTSVYFLPVFFLGYLGRKKEFQAIGKIAGILVGVLFLFWGTYRMIKGIAFFHNFS